MGKDQFKKSQTYKNLLAAFAGESQASMKYRLFASQAKKEGLVHVSNVFEESSRNEKEHAEIWYKISINDGQFSQGLVSNTAENLKIAASGENYEWTSMYKEFAKIAKEEGYQAIANLFLKVGEVEKFHEQRFNSLAADLKAGKVFKDKAEVYWFCLNCGALVKGKDAPKVCPVCVHPQAYFVRKTVKITE